METKSVNQSVLNEELIRDVRIENEKLNASLKTSDNRIKQQVNVIAEMMQSIFS